MDNENKTSEGQDQNQQTNTPSESKPNEQPKPAEPKADNTELKKEISTLSAKLDKVLSLLSQPVKTEENPKVEEETPMDKVETVEEIQNLLDI